MDFTEAAQRIAVVSETRTWINTPYMPRTGVKGVGCDCAYLLIRVFVSCGIVKPFKVGYYKAGLALLREGEQMYRGILKKIARPIEGRDPIPGDIVLFKFAKATHGGIVTQWPMMIHAFDPLRRVVASDVTDPYFWKRVDSIWSAWAK